MDVVGWSFCRVGCLCLCCRWWCTAVLTARAPASMDGSTGRRSKPLSGFDFALHRRVLCAAPADLTKLTYPMH